MVKAQPYCHHWLLCKRLELEFCVAAHFLQENHISLLSDLIDIHEPGQKYWGEGLRKIFRGGRGHKIFWKFSWRFLIIPRGPKKILKKWHFLAKKVKNFFKNDIFFSKIFFLLKILGGGRVPLNQNFIGWEGILFCNW